MESNKNFNAMVIGVGVVIFSLVFFLAAKGFSRQASFVEVKGLSERIVKSDVAIWSIGFDVKSNNVDSLYAEIDKNLKSTRTFLVEKGFEDSEINVAPINVYQDTYSGSLFRYNANVQLSVYTKKVDLLKSTSKDTLELIKKGVTMSQNNVSFEFSDINSIKPEMLAEAIKNAKTSAGQFAEAAGSKVGAIARGNQGVFDITDKDPGSPEYKKIRVVSTLRFLLK